MRLVSSDKLPIVHEGVLDQNTLETKVAKTDGDLTLP